MRQLLIAATIGAFGACSSSPTVRDAGLNELDAGVSVADAGPAPVCFPAGGGVCSALAPSSVCPATELALRTTSCFPNTGAWTSAACSDGGITWSYDNHGGIGPWYTCSYLDGALVGTRSDDDFMTHQVAGRWQLEGCVASDRCAGFDAGIFCDPDPLGRPCGPLSYLTCAPTFDAERTYLCGQPFNQVIKWNRCDGATTWTAEASPNFLATCVYVDGGYVGGAVSGIPTALVVGHWAVANCAPVGGCN
jgi:hypothetical protein